jgi:hypothetical protein
MRAYADTSFLVKLLTQEPGTKSAVADYRRVGRPPVFLLPLHHLEVANAIRQRAFHQRHTTSSSDRSGIKRERDGQENVHLFVLDQAELPKPRHTNESPGHILDRQELIDDSQHLGVVAFLGKGQ